MRPLALIDPRALSGAFVSGVALGVAVPAVASFLLGASRRARVPASPPGPHRLVIDGAKPEDPAALSSRPGTEANSSAASVTSDCPVDIFLAHERW